jgi:hypothetical protein
MFVITAMSYAVNLSFNTIYYICYNFVRYSRDFFVTVIVITESVFIVLSGTQNWFTSISWQTLERRVAEDVPGV